MPANEKFPLPSVVPIEEVLEPTVAVTGAFGLAPVIETSHVSPTWSALPPRELLNETCPPEGAATVAGVEVEI